MDVVAQWVRTWWTKQSHSGIAATRRNAVPVAFTLPAVTPPLVHTIVMKEWQEEFAPQSSVSYTPPDRGEVQLREADGLLRVMLVARLWPAVLRRRPPAGAVGSWRVGAVADHLPAGQFSGPWPLVLQLGHPEAYSRHMRSRMSGVST